ncbi:oligosaccharide flippase family protein [bacterium]|nr:oligosaccharide flippase family protein [bacterium]
MFRTTIEKLIRKDRSAPSFSVNVIYHFASRILSFVLGIVGSIIVARYLGPRGKGIVNTLQTFLSFYQVMVLLGLPIALEYFIANKKYPIKDIIGSFCSFVLYFFFPLTFAFILLTPYLASSFLKGVPSLLLRVSLLISLLTVYLSPLSYSLLALRRFNYSFLINTLSIFFRLVLLASFLILLKWGVWGALASEWFLIPISTALSFYFLNDVIRPEHFSPHLNREVLKGMLKYGAVISLGDILWMVNTRFDVFVVNAYLGARHVGLYMTGVNYTELLRLFAASIHIVLFPQVSSVSPQEARSLTSLLTRLLPFYYLPSALILYFFAPLIIPLLFGSAFRPSISVIPYLLPGIISWMYTGFLAHHILGRGYPQYNLYGSLTGSILTILLDFLLIPRWGIIGASIASSIAYSLAFFVILIFFQKLEKISLKDIFLPRKNDLVVLIEKLKEIAKKIKGSQKQ